MYKIGWFSTGRGEGSRSLLTTIQEAIEKGQIEAEIAFVFSNREPGEAEGSDLFFQLVRGYGIPLVCFSSRGFKAELRRSDVQRWRLEYDREVMARLEALPVDLCVLAGYMLIVGEEMCQHYNMINLHPAAPGGPAGTWREVIWQLIEARAEMSGVMMHLVTPELDKGPVATYCTFPIRGEPFDKHWEEIRGLALKVVKAQQGEDNALFKLIRSEGVKRELPLIVATLKAFSEGKVRVDGQTVVDRKGSPIPGYDLSEEILRAGMSPG